MSEAGGTWVLGEVLVSQGDVDHVRAIASFPTQAAAEAELVKHEERGHPWSGMTTYRVLRAREGRFYLPDGRAYYPKEAYGF